jgi:acyl-CoA synthetase (AMP-forming)/AMP-acid ligase II
MNNISALVDEASARFGGRVAISLDDGPRTFAELSTLSRRGAGVLADTGAKHVVYLGVGGPGFALSMLAASRAGIPYTPVNYRLAAEQIGELVARFDDPVVIADPAYEHMISGPEVVTAEMFAGAAAAQDEADLPPVDPEQVAVVLFTSGTTSTPKAVLLRHSTWHAYVTRQAAGVVSAPDEASLVTVPPYHVMGVAAILNNYYVGRRMVFLPSYTPQGWLDLARAERVTSGSMVPTMMARMVRHLDGRPADVPTLKAIVYGGSRTPRPVLRHMLRAFPTVDFAHGYGLTETSAGITMLTAEEHRQALTSSDPRVTARLGSAGRAVEGIEMQIRDPLGTVVGPDAEGELWVRGAEVSGEYAGLGSVLDADGWFPTRDLAHLDAEGYLFVHGRADDTIIRGGENIAPAEIEDLLDQHPAVRAAAVVGMPDDEWGERIVAAVVARPGTTAEELTAFARQRLRGSRTPDEIRFVEELPYTETGKVHRRTLLIQLSRH